MPNTGHTNDQVTNIQTETSDNLPGLTTNLRRHFNSKIDESADNYHEILQENETIHYVGISRTTESFKENQNTTHFTYVNRDTYIDYVSGYESYSSTNNNSNQNGVNYVTHFRDDDQNEVSHFNSHSSGFDI